MVPDLTRKTTTLVDKAEYDAVCAENADLKKRLDFWEGRPNGRRFPSGCACQIEEDDSISQWCITHGAIRVQNERLRVCLSQAIARASADLLLDLLSGHEPSDLENDCVEHLQTQLAEWKDALGATPPQDKAVSKRASQHAK